jgi:hypothetical protein
MVSTDTSVPHPRVVGMDASDVALFETLIKEASIGFAFFDPKLRFRRVNETLAGIHGVPAEDMVGRRPGEAIAADEATATSMETSLRTVLDEDRALIDSFTLSIEVPVDEAEAKAEAEAEASMPRRSRRSRRKTPATARSSTRYGVGTGHDLPGA